MSTDTTATEDSWAGTKLQKQIDGKRREIQTEGYPMSVGELTNLYRDQELDIHPEFQRFFRWTPAQKSRFIESLLLGIPIPSIFVYQRRDGVWDVIDGLQRLSTVFEFQGLLRSQEGELVPASQLVGTAYLPDLEGMVWDASSVARGLTPQQQRLIKRAAIDVKIVRRESDESTKFDLFQRLNTGGSQLSDQEVRNCLLIMASSDYYQWVLSLNGNTEFQETIALSDRAAAEQYDMELILRFLLLRDLNDVGLRSVGDMSDFLNSSAVAAAESGGDRQADSQAFMDVFRVVNEAAGEEAFRRFDATKGRFLGGFSVSAFETVTIGVYAHIAEWLAKSPSDRNPELRQRIAQMWSESAFRDNSGSGIRATTRLPKTIPFAREHFRP